MSVIDEIKRRIDIVELIGSTVKLTKSGKTFKGLSPFRPERTPSFHVYPESGNYVDFSSGEKGDAFKWLMFRDGLSFKDALRELANRAGVLLEERTEDQRRDEDHETQLRRALTEAADYFHKLFQTAPHAALCREYVRTKRRLSEATIATWQIGYSLNDFQALGNYLQTKGFEAATLIASGLMIENDEGRRYDRFRGRLMIPIRDEKARVIGFGSRSLDGSEPKYMNSPQTAVFDKSHTLFGLDSARASIRNGIQGLTGSVIVEGYMDVIGVAQAGFTNVVSAMGTALTEEQFKILKRLHPRIVLALDPDAAGQRAIMRGLNVARDTLDRDATVTFDPRGTIRSETKLNADIRVAVMPDGKDPDELVLDEPERYRSLIAEARPVVAHVIDALLAEHDISDPRGKSQAVQAIAPILRDLSDPIQRDSYVQTLGRRLQLNPRAIAQTLGLAESAGRRVEHRSPAEEPGFLRPETATLGAGKNSQTNLELHLVALLARNPNLLMDANVSLTRARLTVLGRDDFNNPAMQDAFMQLSRVAMGGKYDPDIADDDWLSLIADVTIQNSDDPSQLREEVVRTGLRIREENLSRIQEGLSWQIQRAKDDADIAALARYNRLAQDTAVNRHRVQKALRLRSALVID